MKKDEILEKLTNIETRLNSEKDLPLTFQETCKYLHFKPSYLYKLTSLRKIKFYKPSGKMLFFNKKDLNEWIFGHYGSASSSTSSELQLTKNVKGEKSKVKGQKKNGEVND